MIGSSCYSSRCFRKGRFWDSFGSVMLYQIYLVEKQDRFGVRLIHVLRSSLVMLLYCMVRVICPSRQMNVYFVYLETSRASKDGGGIGDHERSFEKERTRYNTSLILTHEFSLPVKYKPTFPKLIS